MVPCVVTHFVSLVRDRSQHLTILFHMGTAHEEHCPNAPPTQCRQNALRHIGGRDVVERDPHMLVGGPAPGRHPSIVASYARQGIWMFGSNVLVAGRGIPCSSCL